MKDLTSPFGIKLKGLLFLVIGIAAALVVFLDDPKWQTAVLLALAIWSFCRFYYFAFYVIEKYVDPGYKFSGLISFARYLCRRTPKKRNSRFARKQNGWLKMDPSLRPTLALALVSAAKRFAPR